MKKIIIVSEHCWPEVNPRAFRTDELIQEFSKRNYQIDLVIPYGLGGIYENDDKINIHYYQTIFPKNQIQNQQNTVTIQKRKFILGMKNLLFQLYSLLALEPELLNFWQIKKQLTNLDFKKTDIIFSVSIPYTTHLAVYKYLKNKSVSAIKIADYGDPLCIGNQTHKFLLKPYFMKQEKKIIKWFDYVAVPIESAKQSYLSLKSPEEIIVLPQAVNLDKFEIVEYQRNKTVSFAYAGIFYKNIRYPDKFFAMLTALQIDFHFHLYTNLENTDTEELIRKYQHKLGNKLIVHNFIPRKECIYNLSKYDFLVNFENKTTNQQPSKLIDYAIAARPVLNVSWDGSCDSELLKQNLQFEYTSEQFISSAPFDIKHVVQKIESLRKRN